MTPIEARKILMNLVGRDDFDFAEISPDEVIADFAEVAGLPMDEARELIQGLAANVKSGTTSEQARKYVATIFDLSRLVAMYTGTACMTFERMHEMLQAQLRATAGSDPFCRDADMVTGLLEAAMKSQSLTVCRH